MHASTHTYLHACICTSNVKKRKQATTNCTWTRVGYVGMFLLSFSINRFTDTGYIYRDEQFFYDILDWKCDVVELSYPD
jgi:hypothetical protein